MAGRPGVHVHHAVAAIELIVDDHRIVLPPGLAPGEYLLVAGLYDQDGNVPVALRPDRGRRTCRHRAIGCLQDAIGPFVMYRRPDSSPNNMTEPAPAPSGALASRLGRREGALAFGLFLRPVHDLHLPAGASPGRCRGGRPGRPAERLDPGLGRSRPPHRPPAPVRRQHLLPLHPHAGLFRDQPQPGAAGPAGHPGQRQPGAGLQPGPAAHLRALRAGACTCWPAGSPAAAWAGVGAGIIFAFNAYKLSNLAQIQLLSLCTGCPSPCSSWTGCCGPRQRASRSRRAAWGDVLAAAVFLACRRWPASTTPSSRRLAVGLFLLCRSPPTGG